jgi:DNA polymerase (family X)
MASLGALAVAELLRELAQRSALRGGNPYRARAYARAAESLATLAVPLEQVIREDRLREIPGVGETIAEIVTKLHKTGTHPSLEAMRKEIPAGVLDLLTVPGLRPEKVVTIYNKLGIASLAELEAAARAGKLKDVKGLGASLQTKILQGLDLKLTSEGRWHLHRAAALLEGAEGQLRRARPDLKRIAPAGEFRRGCELVSDLCLVVESSSVRGSSKTISSDSQIKIHLTDPARYGIALLMATGSQSHVDKLKSLASDKGMMLDEWGLHRGRRIVARKSEEQIYHALGLPFIEPELREGQDEIAQALSGKLPHLVNDEDIRGVLHAHTDRSDGVNSLEQMTEATRARGYEYFGVADHSKSAHYAGGLSLKEIEAQHAEIERLNSSYGGTFRILKGIESDILHDGSLDYPDEVLARFDFVVASVHRRFRLSREDALQPTRSILIGKLGLKDIGISDRMHFWLDAQPLRNPARNRQQPHEALVTEVERVEMLVLAEEPLRFRLIQTFENAGRRPLFDAPQALHVVVERIHQPSQLSEDAIGRGYHIDVPEDWAVRSEAMLRDTSIERHTLDQQIATRFGKHGR